MSSLDSANGPSITVRSVPEKRTRLALDVGKSPAPSSRTPALTSSSLNFIIFVSPSSVGITPASVFLSAGPHTITRMFFVLSISLGRLGGRSRWLRLWSHARLEHRLHLGLAVLLGIADERQVFHGCS